MTVFDQAKKFPIFWFSNKYNQFIICFYLTDTIALSLAGLSDLDIQ